MSSTRISYDFVFSDGHHEVIDTQGNIEIDDVGSDKESYCEEVDVVGEDGQVHHVKKWHHHTMDHFQVELVFDRAFPFFFLISYVVHLQLDVDYQKIYGALSTIIIFLYFGLWCIHRNMVRNGDA